MLKVIALSSGLGCAVGLAWIFANMIHYGRFTIYEPNYPWLICEMVLIVLSAVASFCELVRVMRKRMNDSHSSNK